MMTSGRGGDGLKGDMMTAKKNTRKTNYRQELCVGNSSKNRGFLGGRVEELLQKLLER